MTFWSDETWRGLDDSLAPVQPFERKYLKSAKYIMAVGEEVFLSTSASSPVKVLADKESFSISPGQFAYILTLERIRMPTDAIGFISIDADIKFAGLVNISGFHVDPGYHGRIIFSVFNAGPTTIVVRRGDRIFPLWIANLDVHVRNRSPKIGYDEIPSKFITAISGSKYTTAFELDDVVRKLRAEFEEAKLEISSLKNTKLQLLALLAILVFMFGGIVTAGSKFVFNWVSSGCSNYETPPSRLVAPPALTNQKQAPVPVPVPVPAPAPAASAPTPKG